MWEFCTVFSNWKFFFFFNYYNDNLNNQVLQYSSGNYIHDPEINNNEKEYKKSVYINMKELLRHFWLVSWMTWHLNCDLVTNQSKRKWSSKKKRQMNQREESEGKRESCLGKGEWFNFVWVKAQVIWYRVRIELIKGASLKNQCFIQ